MKIYRLVSILFFILFIHFSLSEKTIHSNSNSKDEPSSETNDHSEKKSTGGLRDTIRNTTNNFLHRLEDQRNRIVNLIKPAVKSDFSRNVTNALNSFLDRIESTNSSIVRISLFRNSILVPISTTLSKLKEITADEKVNATELSTNTTSAANDTVVLFMVNDSESDKHTGNQAAALEDEQSLSSESVNHLEDVPPDDEFGDSNKKKNEKKQIDFKTNVLQPPNVKNFTKSSEEKARFTRYKRDAILIDRNYLRANKLREYREHNIFERIRERGQKDCIASALCQADCRSHLFREQSRLNRFRNMFDEISRSDGFIHDDFDYYLAARRLGRQHLNSIDRNPCEICKSSYSCRQDNYEYTLSEYI